MSEHMKSDSEENKDDGGEADGEEEDSYGTTKLKATQKSMVEKAAERKAITGNVPMTAPAATLSKCTDRVSSSSKSSKDKQSSAEDPNSRKSKPITPKLVANSQKVTYQRRSSGRIITLHISPLYANIHDTLILLSNCCGMTKSHLFPRICDHKEQVR